MDRILDKLDDIDKNLVQIEVTLARNTASLDEHMRRTELLEKALDNINKEIEPLKEGQAMIKGVAKAITYLGTIMAIILGFIKLFKR